MDSNYRSNFNTLQNGLIFCCDYFINNLNSITQSETNSPFLNVLIREIYALESIVMNYSSYENSHRLKKSKQHLKVIIENCFTAINDHKLIKYFNLLIEILNVFTKVESLILNKGDDFFASVLSKPYLEIYNSLPLLSSDKFEDQRMKLFTNKHFAEYQSNFESSIKTLEDKAKELRKYVENQKKQILKLKGDAQIANFATQIDNQLTEQKEYSRFLSIVYAAGMVCSLLAIALFNFSYPKADLDQRLGVSIPILSILLTCALLFKYERKRLLEVSYKVSSAKALSVFMGNYSEALGEEGKKQLILTAFDRISQTDGKNDEPNISIDTIMKLQDFLKKNSSGPSQPTL